jgi:hypothetical protein
LEEVDASRVLDDGDLGTVSVMYLSRLTIGSQDEEIEDDSHWN